MRSLAARVLVPVLAALAPFVASGQEGGELVTLDVTVVDGKGLPVNGLTASDFVVREDGDARDITTFTAVSPADPDVNRSLVVFLDDAAVPAAGTPAMQAIANVLVEIADRTDEVSVIRLNNRYDEPFGDRIESRTRIAAFNAGAFPLDYTTQQLALERVAAVARQLETPDTRRKILVCIGAPYICNVQEPSRAAPGRLWSLWVDALTATARANLSVYAIIPGRTRLQGGGLVEFTGGALFANRFDLQPVLDQIMREANHYYVIGYWPEGRARDLHKIEVKTTRKDAKVRVRRRRG
jgi:hypothetical protein